MPDTTRPHDPERNHPERNHPEGNHPEGNELKHSNPKDNDPRAKRTVDIIADHRQREARVHDGLGPQGRIRHFQLHRLLGTGGMGVVHLGWDERLRRPVAIKSLPAEFARDRQLVEALTAEARNLAALSHPNIGSIYDLECDDDAGALHLILEYIEGVTLSERLTQSSFSIEETVRVAREIVSAIDCAHEHGIVHRDLKPSNVMIDAAGRVRVLDFGIAVPLRQHSARSTGGGSRRAGTPRYMCPEQIRGETPDPRWDVWALGCVLFELVSGHPAFAINGPAEFERILKEPPPIQLLPSTIPAALESLIVDCLEKNADQRPVNMRDVQRRLEDLEATMVDSAAPSVVARCYAHETKIELDDCLPLHVLVRVPKQTVEPIRVSLNLAPSSEWALVNTEGPDSNRAPSWTVSPGESLSILVPLRPLAVGTLALPGICVSSPTEDYQETVPPSPLEIRVDEVEVDLTSVMAPLLEHVSSTMAPDSEHCGGWFLIQGQEGSGRTLARKALVRELRSRGVRIVRGAASASGRVERKLLQDLLRSALGVVDREHTPDSLRSFVRERLQDYLGRGADESRYFLELLGDPQGAEVDPHREFRCWVHLLTALAREAPIVLAIDHLESASPETVSLLADILQRCQETNTAVTAIATTGLRVDESLSTLTTHPARQSLVFQLEVPRLDATQIDDVLSQLYPGSSYRDDYPTLVEQILDRTEGRLAATVDLCRTLGSERTPDRLFEAVTPGLYRTFPHRIPEHALDRHVKGGSNAAQIRSVLPVEMGEVLEYCALMGHEFPITPMIDLGVASETIDAALDTLERAGLLYPIDATLENYRFNDRRIPETIRADIEASGSRSAARKKNKVAAALLARYHDDPTSAEWLGTTLIALGEARDGVRALLEVLQQHTSYARYDSAHALIPRIQSVLNQIGPEDSSQALSWHMARTKVLLARRSSSAAREAAREARRVADEVDDPVALTRALLLLAQVQTEDADYDDAIATLRQAESASETCECPELALDARINRAVVEQRCHRLDAAREILESNLEQFPSEEHLLGQTRTRINLGLVLHRQGGSAEAREQFRIAHRCARNLGQSELETQAHVWLCNLDFAEGRFEDARRGYELSIERFRWIQNRRALGRGYFNLAQTESITGRLDLAVSNLRTAVAIAERSGFLLDAQRFLVESAKIMYECGQPAEAQFAIDRAREQVEGRQSAFDHYALDAFEIAWGNKASKLEVQPYRRELERWSSDDESHLEIAAWLTMGFLRSEDPTATFDHGLGEPIRKIVERLRSQPALLPLKVRLLAELSRFPRWIEEVKSELGDSSGEVAEGPAGVGWDLYCIACSNVARPESRPAKVTEATEELSRLLGRIADPNVRSSLRAARLATHSRLLGNSAISG